MKKKISVILFLGLLLLLSPFYADAHVKWFTKLEPVKETIENILSSLFMSVALLSAIIISLLPQILPVLSKWKWSQAIDHKLDSWRVYSRALLKYGTAAALVIQVFSGTVLAPEFQITQSWMSYVMWGIILLLVVPHHIATKAASLGLFGVIGYLTQQNGLFHMLDYGFYVAIAFALLIEKTKIENWGFPFLYLGTGLSLCWVAVEKWVYPGLSLDIVATHHVPTFGFAPSAFIVLAAFIEFVVGYLLVVGVLNRTLSVVVTLIFISTTLLFGYTEVVGHFMIHILLIIFLIEGVSFYNPPIKMHERKIDQIVFIFLNFLFMLGMFLLIYYRFA